jgi:hypothetical protein
MDTKRNRNQAKKIEEEEEEEERERETFKMRAGFFSTSLCLMHGIVNLFVLCVCSGVVVVLFDKFSTHLHNISHPLLAK